MNTREQKISCIKRLASVEGISFLSSRIKISKGEGDMIGEGGLMEEICGDWVYIADFAEMTDADIDIVYMAMQNHAREIMALA